MVFVMYFHTQNNVHNACSIMLFKGDESTPKHEAVKGSESQSQEYQPGSVEQYIMNNLDQLGFTNLRNPNTCQILKDVQETAPEIFHPLAAYKNELDVYNEMINNFIPVANTMDKIRHGGGDTEQSKICDSLRIHPDGMQGIFPSKQLSFTSSGYMEPLLPPMRSHKLCDANNFRNLMSLDYLVHDFEFMCRKLKPTSKLVLLDLGASLEFHVGAVPMLSLMKQYEKFGFVFDHIYAFEITKQDPEKVYGTFLPEEYIPSYHWINVGVSKTEDDKLNPLHSIVKTLHEDDFVVMKLDIDTSSIEVPLARELLKDKDGVYSKIVDQFYFEHHVHLGELATNWGSTMDGSVAESLDLFSNLRRKGIPAHFWP